MMTDNEGTYGNFMHSSSAVSNCNVHKCSIARRQERSIRSFAMSIAKQLMWFTSLTVTSADRNT
jgi:hypothetical protein